MSKTATRSTLPDCDICGAVAHYDGKTVDGYWAYMCPACFHAHGVGLGMGKGQRLEVAQKPRGEVISK